MPSPAVAPPPPPYTPPPSDASVSSFTGSDPPPPPPALHPSDTRRLPEPEPQPEFRSPQQPTGQRVLPSLARLPKLDAADAPRFTVTFAAPGPLGMTLVEHGEIKVVDRIATGKQADQTTELRPGLLVDTVQGIAANTLSMGEVGELLQQRPVTVSFVSCTTGGPSYRDSVRIEPARNMELSVQARVSTEQALSRLVAFTQGTALYELAACATAALEFLLLHGASCLIAGPVHALEMLLEPLLCMLTTSSSGEMMALALPAVHGLLPYVFGAMMDAQMPTAEGFPFLVTVIESLADGVSCALSFHGAGVLLHQLLDALSLVFEMMAPHHLPRDTLSMLVLALFRVMLRASATPASPAGATVSSSRLSELLAPTDALFQRLGVLTFGWLAATTTPLQVPSAATAVRTDTAGQVDWVQLEESLSQFVSQPPAGSPGLLGEGVLTDADVERWLSATSSSTTAGRPALQLIAALGKLMIHEMPVRRSNSTP